MARAEAHAARNTSSFVRPVDRRTIRIGKSQYVVNSGDAVLHISGPRFCQRAEPTLSKGYYQISFVFVVVVVVVGILV